MDLRAADPRPFISIVAWPEGALRDDVAELVASATHLDAATLRLRLGKEPPMVIEQVEPDAARNAVSALLAAGGDAFAFTLAELEALGPTLTISDLRVVAGAVDVDLHQGMSTTIPSRNIQVLVRAQIARTVTVRVEPRFSSISRHTRSLASRKAAIESSVRRDLETSEKLDIHTADGSVFQIDGDRFAYSALGDLKGYGDKVNMDRMCELLELLAPEEVVDTFFPLWHPPVGHHRLAVPGVKEGREDPAFAFYSRWAATVYRHVLGVR